MPDTVSSSRPAESSGHSVGVGRAEATATLVVLLACEPCATLEGLVERLKAFNSCGPVRVLVRGDCPQALEAGRRVAASGIWPVELVLAPGLLQPEPGDSYAHLLTMPVGTAPQDLDDLVLAFSDALLWFGVDDAGFVVRARVLGKSEQPAPEWKSAARGSLDLGASLNPSSSLWGKFWFVVAGLVDQQAIAWLSLRKKPLKDDPKRGSLKNGWEQIRSKLSSSQRNIPYIGPGKWLELCPDPRFGTRSSDPGSRDALLPDENQPLIRHFLDMERQALHGSFLHRDSIWLVHFFGAFAVFAAVAGAVHLWFENWVWYALELAVLALILSIVYRVRTSRLHERWALRRFVAEQLRVALVTLPVLVIPRILLTPDRPTASLTARYQGPVSGEFENRTRRRLREEHHHSQALQAAALTQIKYAVREQGPTQVKGAEPTLEEARDWLELMLQDQVKWHKDNIETLTTVEVRLSAIARAIFILAFVAVLAHFGSEFGLLPHVEWGLLLTAAFPAIAAAAHGAAARLGISNRARQSEVTLAAMQSQVERVRAAKTWETLRYSAAAAGDIMSSEADAWHRIVRAHDDDVPS